MESKSCILLVEAISDSSSFLISVKDRVRSDGRYSVKSRKSVTVACASGSTCASLCRLCATVAIMSRCGPEPPVVLPRPTTVPPLSITSASLDAPRAPSHLPSQELLFVR